MKIVVIVPVRQAQYTLRATLDSLVEQAEALNAHIVVAVCESDPSCAILREIGPHPLIQILVAPGRRSVPQLRGEAVAAAIALRAEYVVITEDHCTFPPAWLQRLVEAAAPNAVSGGGVLNGRTSWAGWAQYFTRYSIFQPPLPAGLAIHLPGNNACYAGPVLDRYAHLLKDGFWEAEFNAEARKTFAFRIVSGCDVVQYQYRGMFEFVLLRFRHGRCYGARREDKQLARALLIPAILFWRAARAVFERHRQRVRFLLASPLLLLYFAAWAAGEAWGYRFGAGDSCSDTD